VIAEWMSVDGRRIDAAVLVAELDIDCSFAARHVGYTTPPPGARRAGRSGPPASHPPASARWSLVASPGRSRPERRWCARYLAA
jgi:hypothetical protein